VLDEIQTGLGRLGTWWGADAEGVRPDVLLSGKVLSGGVIPVGAVIATSEVFAPLDADPLLHSSTYGGNALAAAAVTATIRTIRDEGLVTRSAELGDRIKADASEILGEHCPWLVREVRGRGLLIGLDFTEASVAAEFLMAMLEQHVVMSYSLNTHSVVRLTPPATLAEDDLAWLSTAMRESAVDLARRHPRPASGRRAA
jgi:putrescine aminotransferase